MTVLVTAEIVVGACLFAAIAALAFIFARRRWLSRGGDLILCALRPDVPERWRSGLLRFDETSIAWLPLLSASLRPTYCWERYGLDLGNFAELEPGEALGVGSVRAVLRGVPIGRGPDRAEIALGQEPYTALRAWVEATPPGRRPVDW